MKKIFRTDHAFLDKILKIIHDKSTDFQISFDDLYCKIYNYNFFEQEKSNLKIFIEKYLRKENKLSEISLSVDFNNLNNKDILLIKALEYLENQRLIEYSENNIHLLYLGILKHKNGGFCREYVMKIIKWILYFGVSISTIVTVFIVKSNCN